MNELSYTVVRLSSFEKRSALSKLLVFIALAAVVALASITLLEYALPVIQMVMVVSILVLAICGMLYISVRGIHEHLYGALERYSNHLSSLDKTQLLHLYAHRNEITCIELQIVKRTLTKNFPGWSLNGGSTSTTEPVIGSQEQL